MLKACCPVVFDMRLHEIEKERREEVARRREWLAHGTILNLKRPVHQQTQSEMLGV